MWPCGQDGTNFITNSNISTFFSSKLVCSDPCFDVLGIFETIQGREKLRPDELIFVPEAICSSYVGGLGGGRVGNI